MKIRIYLALLVSTLFVACSGKSKVNIEIPEVRDGNVAIVYASPDQMTNSIQNIIYSSDFKDGKISIDLDSISFEKDILECALQISSSDEKFYANVPLPLEKGKTLEIKFTNIEEYNNGGRIKTSYKGSKHAEDFTIFWDKIQNQLLEFRNLKTEQLDQGYQKFVEIYKPYIEKYPQSGFPYMLLIPQINNMQFDKTNPLLDYSNTLCVNSKDNKWKEIICSLVGERKLAQETSKKLVFNAVDLNGKSYSERDIKGKIVLIDFWATWCKPCLEEIPHLKQINNKYNSKGLTLVSISIDRAIEDWKKYNQSNPLPWMSLFGDGNVITKRYDFQYIPFNIISDSEGNILAKNLHGEELEKFIEGYFQNEKN